MAFWLETLTSWEVSAAQRTTSSTVCCSAVLDAVTMWAVQGLHLHGAALGTWLSNSEGEKNHKFLFSFSCLPNLNTDRICLHTNTVQECTFIHSNFHFPGKA